ncbi:MAG: pyrimidine 5'-nucleotidase [Armatimonadetes bacterium]|nr:pyrimidine 5'-nucleotidase [Armatimonadota bacterium]
MRGSPPESRDTDVRAILADLDNTLYPPECGLLLAGDRRITDFIHRRLGLSWQEADELRVRLWKDYGTTARGLAEEYGIPEVEMSRAALESMDPSEYVPPAPELREMIRLLPVPLYVFTNSTARYAARVLEALGIADLVGGIFDIEFMRWNGKPSEQAFEKVLGVLGVPPQRVVLADDNAENLKVAHGLGMVTVAVGTTCEADYCIGTITELADVLQAGGLL